MSTYKVLGFLEGEFELLEQIRQTVDELAYSLDRIKKRPGHDAKLTNRLFIKLSQWERNYTPGDKTRNHTDEEAFSVAVTYLQRIASFLTSVEPSRYHMDIRIQVICTLGNDGLLIPKEFLKAVDTLGLPLGISILALPEEEGGNGEDDRAGDDHNSSE